MVDPGAALVQADRLDDHVPHPQRDERPVQPVAERPGFVAAMHRRARPKLVLNPLEEFGGRELLRRLRRAVVEEADHDNRIGMDVQPELDRLRRWLRGLLRANFGGNGMMFVIHVVGGCSPSGLACQLLMPSPNDALSSLGSQAEMRLFLL